MNKGHERQGMIILNACAALAIIMILVTIFLKWATHQ